MNVSPAPTDSCAELRLHYRTSPGLAQYAFLRIPERRLRYVSE